MSGIDYEKLRKAQAEAQARMARGGSSPSMKYWKPADGENRIRVMPPWTEEGDNAGVFWREVHQHWNVVEGEGPILCPKKTPDIHEQDCPICDFVDQLRSKKSDVEAQELAKNLRAKVAYLMSVIDLRDPVYTAKDLADWKKERPDSEPTFSVGDPKVQLYAATSTIYEQIANIVLANEMDITDRTAGHNIIINKVPNKDKMKTRYTISPDLKKTKAPIPDDYKLPNLDKVGRVLSYDDLTKKLTEGHGDVYKALPSSTPQRKADDDENPAWGIGSADDAGDLAEEMRAHLR